MNRTPLTPPPSDVEARLATWLEEGPTSGPDELLSRTFARARSTRQQRVWRHRLLQPTRSSLMNSALKFTAVAVLALAVGIGIGPLLSSSPDVASAPAAADPSPSPTAVALGSDLEAGTYVATPFAGPGSSGVCEDPPQAGCTETATDDAITFTFDVPDGWAGLPPDGISSSDGTGLLFQRGGDLYDDPCASEGTPQIAVGPTVADFTNAVAEHPLLDTTTPVDVELGGYNGTYLELQVPVDLTGCTQFRPWYPWYYAQAPGERWQLWALDVNGVRVVVQAIDHAETPPERQAELLAIVDSISIDTLSNGWIAYATEPGTAQDTRTDPASEIYLVREGEEPRLLASAGTESARNLCPDFSPDGAALAYGEGLGLVSRPQQREHRAIVIVRLDEDGSIVGTASRLPVAGIGYAPCPQWSPDGQHLAFTDGGSLIIMGLDGSSKAVMDWQSPTTTWTEAGWVTFEWSPEGSMIAAAQPTGTWLAAVDGGPPRLLRPASSHSVSWSPDGSQIAITEGSGRTFLVPVDDRRVVVDLGSGSQPVWSPSGDRVAYQDGDGIVVADRDGSDAEVITSGAYGLGSWSPDGRSLLSMQDISGHSWDLLSTSVVAPNTTVVVAHDIPTSSGRSWPARGDVSWQAVHP